ncbi:hydrogenase expression/formation protein HypE [Thermosulfuriphilus ammonigenes]|uniref:Hydrogenase expression/formation protein HypE n=1 Tax=Thermosulfuriphilus ammonigenes TaxID=1936021 RepID=A0A6G7PVI2_9BACT|nr:hydrogenase expression/formation protein HypE [Thermosulfuriphilus ammonigenes]MBA2848130.1 hydrogenase expression/formation protein HypE [Thermosulfuriphilus ammonigenes]QIJ71694.1 hydrogenase expression/formation protein HypE [Thermosulfuriphilus ammonigenes]
MTKVVLLDHGSGGRASQELIEGLFLRHLGRPEQLLDAAVLKAPSERLAFTTDSFVVDPIFFPGGDIGSLAVHGTINDLAMVGADPLFLSAGFILEEGLSLEELEAVVASMARAARSAGVCIVTGDTKVVPRGKADRIFINTAGIGLLPQGVSLGPDRIRSGDEIILSGPIAEHGLAVLSAREGLELEGLSSDTAPLHALVKALLSGLGEDLHALRDPTRGGLATALNELAETSGSRFIVFEDTVPIRDEVRFGCELLGLDPLYLANEGRLIAFVSRGRGKEALQILKEEGTNPESAIIGYVDSHDRAQVILKTVYGGERILPMLSGEPLPRIC